ncbi:hypothetical protein B4135_0196 [Caldibacillus debilis]|uniref:Uncharacterized protein n=1 Tax=Caldibacillus debilis TaxID=301148 RepID=A0A150M9T6_9BACI|nr:hypothetical protein B4135_0196 [Caldibacillus debilis]
MQTAASGTPSVNGIRRLLLIDGDVFRKSYSRATFQSAA